MYYNNKKLVLSIIWVVLGIVLIILSCMGKITSPYCSGLGGGLIAVGILQIVKNLKYKNDDSFKEKIDIEATDERNRFLRMKAWSWVGYVLLFGVCITEIVFFVMGKEKIGELLSYVICGIIGLYWLVYFILQKRY